MACRFVQFEVDGRKVSAIVKLQNPPRKKCRFCATQDVKTLCDWPVVKLKSIFASDLVVGDRFHFHQVRRPDMVHIVELIDLEKPNVTFVAYRIPGLPPQVPYRFQLGQRIYVERAGTCDAPCCYKHRRHVGVDTDYCADHWDAWPEGKPAGPLFEVQP